MAEEKRKFPSEVVDLPSKGLLYPKDHPCSSGQIEIKYMTAKEEDILTSRNLIQKGIVLDKLMESVIIDEKVKLDDLLLGDKNEIIIGYGAPAKATTALNFFGITKEIDFIVEDNKLKHNKFVPGVKIPIKRKSEIKDKNNTIVVLAWNFFQDIKKNNSTISKKFINIKDLE